MHSFIIKRLLHKSFIDKIEALRKFEKTMASQLIDEREKLDKEWNDFNKGILIPKDSFEFVHSQMEDASENEGLKEEFLLLITVGINTAIEALLKRLVNLTGRIKDGKEWGWNIKQLSAFYEEIGIPITENNVINDLRRICNRYKHNESLCDSVLESKGFGENGYRIEIMDNHLMIFYEKALEFAKDTIYKTPIEESEESRISSEGLFSLIKSIEEGNGSSNL